MRTNVTSFFIRYFEFILVQKRRLCKGELIKFLHRVKKLIILKKIIRMFLQKYKRKYYEIFENNVYFVKPKTVT
jgi:hypothetical protein